MFHINKYYGVFSVRKFTCTGALLHPTRLDVQMLYECVLSRKIHIFLKFYAILNGIVQQIEIFNFKDLNIFQNRFMS